MMGGLVKRILSTAKNAVFALPIGILDIFAGYIVTQMLSIITLTPQLLVIYPMLLTARGNLNGILTGNISTLLHLGTIKPSLTDNTEEFYSLTAAITLLSIYTGIYIGLIPIINTLTLETTFENIILTFLSALNTIIIATYLNIPMTMLIAGKTFESALDPDVIAYPVMSTLSDILVSLIFTAITMIIYYLQQTFPILTVLLTITILIPAFTLTLKFKLSSNSIQIIKETLPLITVLLAVSWGTGNILSRLLDIIKVYPIILTVYPAFATLMGDIGSIVGSITTTKLYLGELKPHMKSLSEIIPEVMGILCVSVGVLFISTSLAGILTSTSFYTIFQTYINLLTAHLILIPILVVITTGIAFITFIRGLNADNFVIPVETTTMDLMTVLTILLVITLI